ncbi:hypothetical protein [Tenacibaculum agarivorans]|uniref:hypothetical protein n=1 Tax=Tenacibaculum agarivorans TaxID=1908389 RepID=UPI00094BAFCD|nr:hypothetical protein [Tenacibaculum agarivorans]
MLKKKNVLLLWMFITSQIFYSQEEIGSFSNDLKTNSTDIKDVIPIVNSENGNIAMFIADAKNVYGYKLNSDLKVIDKLASETKRRKYKILLGNSIVDDTNYRIFLANKNKSKFLSINFSFKDKTTTSKEYKLQDFDEKLVQTVSVNNKFYLITRRYEWDIMYVYTFDENGKMERTPINLTQTKFITNSNKDAKITNLLRNKDEEVKEIDTDLPNTIELVGDRTKMYVRDNTIVFTFDQNNAITQILTINLDDLSASKKTFEKPLDQIKNTRKKSNSFINGDKIFLVSNTKDVLVLNIADYTTGEVLKSYSVAKEEAINFKNTPIIQEGGAYANYRELEKTKKFLRKIYGGKVGVAVRKLNNDSYQMTLGGYKLQQQGGAMMMAGFGGGFGGLTVASFGNVSVYFNPAMFAYNASTNTKSTRIESLFDNEFNHIEGDVKENVFDKIPTLNIAGIAQKSKTVFKYKDYFIYGEYHTKSKQYKFKKYTDD